ncbi:MAG: LysR family transcriptional regulator [Gammaproteobacteria bacterium]|jgi:DNA-binding transcriptional LysR family regulator
MRLDTESLRALKTAIDLGSLTIAARHLSLTTSAVSWKLKRLEERVGRKLIARNGHQIEPTRDARQLLEYADVILDAHDQAVRQFHLSPTEGRIVVGISDDLASAQLPAFVSAFHRSYPAVRLEIRVEQQLALLDWFEDRSIDLAVLPIEDPMLREDDTVLWTDELVWVQSRSNDYPLDRPVPLVTFSPSCTYREAAFAALKAAGVDYYVSMESPSLAGVQGIVSAGMGVTLINRGLMTPDQCEWPESRSFHEPRRVSFVLRIHSSLPAPLRDLIEPEIRRFFNP